MKEKEKEKEKEKYTSAQGIWYVVSQVWKEKRGLVALSFLRIPILALFPFWGILMSRLVVQLVTEDSQPLRFLWMILALTAVMVLFNVGKNWTEAKAQIRTNQVQIFFERKIYDKLVNTDYENVESFEGQMKRQKALPHDYAGMSGVNKIFDSLDIILSSVLGFALYAGVIGSLSPLILLLLLALSVLSFFFVKYINSFEGGYLNRRAIFERRLYYLEQNEADFHNGKDIRLYQMVPWFKSMFRENLKERDKEIKNLVARQFYSSIFEGTQMLIRDGICYAYLIYLIVEGRIPLADFVFYTGAVAGFSTWIRNILDNVSWIGRSGTMANGVREYLEMPEHLKREGGAALPKSEELPCQIEFSHVTFSYTPQDEPVLKDFNLKIKKGEKLALVGVNGAGKTTLVKLLCGLYRPTEGEVLVNGKRPDEYSRDEYYTLFSVAFQDIHLLPMSVAKNVALCPDEEIDRERVKECLKKAGLWEKTSSWKEGMDTVLVKGVEDEAVDLSGGEQQKLIFARALYRDRPVLVLDEPTAALDPVAENEMYLQYEKTAENKTSLFISHRLSSTRFCDRIIFLENGQIAEEGSHEELMSRKGGYAKMFEIQSQYYKESDNERGESL